MTRLRPSFFGGLVATALLAACAPAPDVPDGTPSTQLDVACEPWIADTVFRAPERWTPASPEYIAYAAWLTSSPYRQDRAGRVDTHIADLLVMDGALYVGIGDGGFNAGSRYCPDAGEACPQEDAPGHGMPILRLHDLASDQAEVAHVVHEEEVSRFRAVGADLLVPGIDNTLGDAPLACQDPAAEVPCPEEDRHPTFSVAAFHRLRGGRWTDDDDAFAHGMHIYDHAELGGCLFAAGSSLQGPGNPATVWSSCDDGARWTVVYQDVGRGSRRMTTVVPVGGSLVALGFHRGDPDVRIGATWGPDGWQPHDELATDLAGHVLAEVVGPGRAIAWSDRTGAASRLTEASTGQVVATAMDGVLDRVLDVSLRCPGDVLVLSRTEPNELDARTYAVHRTSDLQELDELVTWSSTIRFVSLAYWQGTLILGSQDGTLYQAGPGPGP